MQTTKTKNETSEVTSQRASGKRAGLAGVAPGVTVKFGLDVHAAQITVCRQIDGQLPQPAQRRGWTECGEWLEAHVQAGACVHSCYEAGPCGYGLHRRLTALGVTNVVVAPQRWDEHGRRVKTDGRDARELCDRLDRFVRGNAGVFSVVRVPTVDQERARALGRQRGSVLRERQRCEVRGHGLMLQHGVQAPAGWWQPATWTELAPQLPAWLLPHVRRWRDHARRLDAELVPLTAQVTALATGPQPKGLGALTAATIDAEVLDWSRFKNRRQIASYTGLCPGESSSGARRRQGAVTKHGNPRLRHALVEAAWRLAQWQPDYPPLQRLHAAAGARARKRAIVAVARRLAIDLWRIRTGQCTAEQLGLQLLAH
jgi:transposase